jgi:hypothetical protein
VKVSALLFCALLEACYRPPPRAPAGLLGATPPTPQQIDKCKSELAWKNWSTVLSAGFGGAGGVAGAAAADITGNQKAQIGVEVGAISSAAIGVAFIVVGAIESNNYGAGRCDAVLTQ